MNYYDTITYDKQTGYFTWSKSRPGCTQGARAGSVSRYGYLVIKVSRKQVRAHRLAWFLSFGVWPDGEVDHINGDRIDNRLCNLRVVDRSTNSQNQRNAQRDNLSSGLLGVTWNKQHKRWQSKIMVNRVFHHVGLFATPEEAHTAYLVKKRQLHAGCTI